MLQNQQRDGKQTKVGTRSQEVQGAWQGKQEGASLWGRVINWHRATLLLETSLLCISRAQGTGPQILR